MDFPLIPLDKKSQRIHDRAIVRASNFRHAEGEMLESVMEVDEARLHEKFSEESTFSYCVRVLKLEENLTLTLIRVARMAKNIPEVKEAIDRRELTLSQSKRIASVITPENKQEWLEKAKTLTQAQLEREVAGLTPNSSQERIRRVGDKFEVKMYLTEEEMAEFRRAKDVLKQNSITETTVTCVREQLKKKDPVQKAHRNKKDWPQGHLTTDEIPSAAKHIVNARDKGKCQARHPDGTHCHQTRWVHIHHIKERHKGGTHHPQNLITLCSAHHRMWHKREERAWQT
jgi:hypothetical protein